ncbi:NAD-dependent epimerase/dehydratase family protein, partial [Candidatus Gottesmanbacteria bacterium]|nr:NAD-dependent epimerase/dehydratase family protein [Candidatus Gottesmanbacteria bacterium]
IEFCINISKLFDFCPVHYNTYYEIFGYRSAGFIGNHYARVKRFIYATSTSCYGIPKFYPTPESALCNLEYPYALTKFVAEVYVLHWGVVYKLPVIFSS